VQLDRGALFADTSRTGAAWCRAYSDLVDAWLAKVFQDATGSVAAHGIALVAVGGYGRAELCPHSDIDVILVHADRDDVAAVADRLWYPVWDEGLRLGHSVRTVREALALARDDLDTATALLSARHLAGDTALSVSLCDAGLAQWQKGAKTFLGRLGTGVSERHERAGEVAFLLEPDLKDGRGGLRDVHALHWAAAARTLLLASDDDAIGHAADVLLAARVELHRRTDRSGNRLLLQEQEGIADALGYEGADALMAAVAAAGRSIAWTSDDTWRRVSSSLRGPLGRIARRDRALAEGLVLRDGEVHLSDDAAAARDPSIALRAAALAAGHETVIDRDSLERFASVTTPVPDPWPDDVRDALVDLLLCGRAALPTIEALDQRGIWTRYLPEWSVVSSRPQRNAYHRFTVDRHLVEASLNAAALADTVDRPDLLVLGALLHDIGKGRPGDHTEVGMVLARDIATRTGLPSGDVDTIVAMVEHHLLLPDVATRRDLDDPGTIESVAHAVPSVSVLRLLAALTEADSLATGQQAWSPWKATLVDDLVTRVAYVLEGGAVTDVAAADELSDEQRVLMAAGEQRVEGRDDRLIYVAQDEPGMLSRVAGALTMRGIAVLAAAVHTDERGMGLAELHVAPMFERTIEWARLAPDVERAVEGTLDVASGIAERERTYDGAADDGPPIATAVRFDNEVSHTATVIEVHARDRVGLLYRVTAALAGEGLNIRSAKVQTMGALAVDSFYVRDAAGAKVSAEDQPRIERTVVAAVHR
jgi:[protein-PII] uridylyltransferase